MTAVAPRSLGPPDAELIARVLGTDDRHAFATLVRRHQSPIRGLLRRLSGGDDGLADDMAQEAFVKAYRSLGNFGGRASFATWLQKIAYNCFVSEMRRHHRPLHGDESRDSTQSAPSSLRVDLETALRSLGWEDRAALVCAYARDLSHEEGARALGWPLGTFKTRVASAKDKLRARLPGWEEGCSDG